MFGFFKKKKYDEPNLYQQEKKVEIPQDAPQQKTESEGDFLLRTSPSFINGTAELINGYKFNQVLNDITLGDKFHKVRYVKFTDMPLPSHAGTGRDQIVDVSKDNDSGVVAWYDRENQMVIVTSQRPGIPIKAKTMSFMFKNCQELYYINFEGLDTSEVTSFRALFENCWRLQTLDLRPLDVSHVTDMSFMCDNCLFLTDIDVSTWTATNLEEMYHMFGSCYFLHSLDLSSFHSNKITSIKDTFLYCPRLEFLNVSGLSLKNVTQSIGESNTFEDCRALKAQNIKCTDQRWLEQYAFDAARFDPKRDSAPEFDGHGSSIFDRNGDLLLRTGGVPVNPFKSDTIVWECKQALKQRQASPKRDSAPEFDL